MSDTTRIRDRAEEQWARYVYMRDFGHLDFCKKADKCDRFFEGLQWAEEDMARLRASRRPALTINKIISTLSTLMGEQIYNRMEVSFRPKGATPAELTDVWNKLWLHIASSNQLNWKRSDVFADGIIRSRGFYDVRLDFSDSVRGEVAIGKLNGKDVLIDPDADDYDPDTWNDVIVSRWMTPADISILYDEQAGKDLADRGTSEFLYGFDSVEQYRDRIAGRKNRLALHHDDRYNSANRFIRVLDRQYRELRRVEFFVDPATGDMREVPAGWDRERIVLVRQKYGLEVMKKVVKKVKWVVTADTLVLHDDWSPYKRFTTVPYFPYFRDGVTIGVAENLLGPQELLNKSSSQELHVINTTANSGWKVKRGALQNMTIQELEQSGARTGLVLELDEIDNIDKIQPNQIPSGLENITRKAEEHIKTISNVSDSMQGFDREDVAARAIQAKTARGSVNQVKLMDNLERSDYFLARAVMDLVQEFYTEHRVFKITGDDLAGTPQTLEVNAPGPDGVLNDLTLGEFGIVVTSAPYRATLEDSQFEQALALREAGVPIPDDVLIENSRLMRKSELAKRIQDERQDPQAQAKEELNMRALQAEVATREADAQKKQADAHYTLAKAQSEGGQGGEEMMKLELERQRAQMQIELERAKAAAQIEMEREKLRAEMEMKREQHMQDMALKQEMHQEQIRASREAARQKAMQDRVAQAMQGSQESPAPVQ